MSERDRDLVSRMHQVYSTLTSMLETRGYIVPVMYRDFDHFESCFNFSSRDSLNFSVNSPAGDVCMVFFMNEEKTATATVRNVFEKIKAVDRVKCAVFVIRKMMVPQARKALTEGMRECRCPITVDVFTESELVVNVMKHELVPEHKILSPADKRELLRKYHVTEAQLPRILITDPVSKFIGLKKGQVVRITRDSLTAGRYVTYRICT